MVFKKPCPNALPPEEVQVDYKYQRVTVADLDGNRFEKMQKVVDDHKDYDAFVASDFGLRELIESGKADLLQPTGTIQSDRLSALDAATSGTEVAATKVAQIDDAVAAAAQDPEPSSSAE